MTISGNHCFHVCNAFVSPIGCSKLNLHQKMDESNKAQCNVPKQGFINRLKFRGAWYILCFADKSNSFNHRMALDFAFPHEAKEGHRRRGTPKTFVNNLNNW